MNFKVLNLYYNNNILRSVNISTPADWEIALDGFDQNARYHAANMAAHGWNVLWFGESILICGPGNGTYYNKDGSRRPQTIIEHETLFPRILSDEVRSHDNAVRCWDEEKIDATKGEIWRTTIIDLSSFGEEGRRFNLMNRALRLCYRNFEYMDWRDSMGEPLDYERKQKRFKSKMQKFWDELSKD